MFTKQDIINERLKEFEYYLRSEKAKRYIDIEEEDSLYHDFEFNCEIEAIERNKELEENDLEIDYEEVQKQAIFEETNIISLNKQWLNLFKKRSYCNEIPGKVLFRILLCASVKNKPFIGCNNKLIKFLLHLFFIQNSGSGKDESIDFFIEVVNKINEKYLLKHNKKLLTIYDLNGSESMESLLDSYIRKRNNKGSIVNGFDYSRIAKGIFSSYDIIISRECSFLFRESVKDKQMKRELFLQALEGKNIPKKLVSWEGNETITFPNFCFIGCSRPIENMREHIVTSGLQQRAFNYCREVDSELRLKMLNEMGKNGIVGSKESVEKFKKELNSFCDNFIDLIDRVKTEEFTFESTVEIDNIIINNLTLLYNDVSNNIYKNNHKDILESFISRFKDIILILSYENAMLKRCSNVTKTDVQISVNAIKENFDILKLWIEGVINETKEEKFKYYEIEKNIKLLLANGSTQRKTLVKGLSKLSKCSEIYAYQLVQKYLRGDNSFLIINNNKEIDLRK